MAEKRMFTKKITCDERFYSMSASAQSLYFHMNMMADDDGFCNCVSMCKMMSHASDDDLTILIAKKYIIPFESGVMVIKHWRMHNILRKDRYTETSFKEEKSTLFLDENSSYTVDDGEIIEEVKKEKKPLTGARLKRLEARKNGDLPYSFDYKIRHAFVGEKCPICGIAMGVVHRESADDILIPTPYPSVQHNIPISKGGTHTLDNISVICERCNHSIQDNETGSLNNELVVKKWEEICLVAIPEPQYSIDKYSIDNNTVPPKLGETTPKPKQPSSPSLGRPSLEEVVEYVASRGNKINAEKFFYHYEANGWVQGKGKPIKNWKACVITWENRQNDGQDSSFKFKAKEPEWMNRTDSEKKKITKQALTEEEKAEAEILAKKLLG